MELKYAENRRAMQAEFGFKLYLYGIEIYLLLIRDAVGLKFKLYLYGIEISKTQLS